MEDANEFSDAGSLVRKKHKKKHKGEKLLQLEPSPQEEEINQNSNESKKKKSKKKRHNDMLGGDEGQLDAVESEIVSGDVPRKKKKKNHQNEDLPEDVVLPTTAFWQEFDNFFKVSVHADDIPQGQTEGVEHFIETDIKPKKKKKKPRRNDDICESHEEFLDESSHVTSQDASHVTAEKLHEIHGFVKEEIDAENHHKSKKKKHKKDKDENLFGQVKGVKNEYGAENNIPDPGSRAHSEEIPELGSVLKTENENTDDGEAAGTSVYQSVKVDDVFCTETSETSEGQVKPSKKKHKKRHKQDLTEGSNTNLEEDKIRTDIFRGSTEDEPSSCLGSDIAESKITKKKKRKKERCMENEAKADDLGNETHSFFGNSPDALASSVLFPEEGFDVSEPPKKSKKKSSKSQDALSNIFFEDADATTEELPKSEAPPEKNFKKKHRHKSPEEEADVNSNENFSVEVVSKKDKKKKESGNHDEKAGIDADADIIGPANLSELTTIKKKKKKKTKDHKEKEHSIPYERDPLSTGIPASDEINNPMMASKKPQFCSEIGVHLSKAEKNIFVNEFLDALDMSEEPVDFEIPPLHAKESVKLLRREEKEELMSNGVKIYSGQWTKKEQSILIQNWLDFSEKFSVGDPCPLLGLYLSSKEMKMKVFAFNKAKHFYVRLARGLDNRPLFAVYKKARVLLDPRNKNGKLSKEELGQLRRFHNLYGGRWAKISGLMDRTSVQCESAHRNHKDNRNLGVWQKEEEKLLKKAVRKFVSDQSLLDSPEKCKGIQWKEVSKIVGTRNEFQCREHWFNSKKLHKEKKFVKWDKLNAACLIYFMFHNMVSDEVLVDWKSAYPAFRGSVSSCKTLAKHWYKLKKKVRKYKKMNHKDIVTHLYNINLPVILSKLKKSIDVVRKILEDAGVPLKS